MFLMCAFVRVRVCTYRLMDFLERMKAIDESAYLNSAQKKAARKKEEIAYYGAEVQEESESA